MSFADPRLKIARSIMPFNAQAYNTIERALADYFSTKGRVEPQLTATLLHIARETGGSFDPRQREVGQRRGRGGFGIMQWTAGRAAHFVAWAAEKGVDAEDLQVQIDYLILELNNDRQTFKGGTAAWGWNSNGRRREFFSTDDFDKAVLALLHGFIRPGFSFTTRNGRTRIIDADEALRISLRANRLLPRGTRARVASLMQGEQLVQQASMSTSEDDDDGVSDRDAVVLLQTILNTVYGENLTVDGLKGRLTTTAANRAFGRRSLT